jgi:hypothetical protein
VPNSFYVETVIQLTLKDRSRCEVRELELAYDVVLSTYIHNDAPGNRCACICFLSFQLVYYMYTSNLVIEMYVVVIQIISD